MSDFFGLVALSISAFTLFGLVLFWIVAAIKRKKLHRNRRRMG